MIRVGQRLQKERVGRNLTIEDVSKATKIRASFLSALEKGDFKNLPSSTYSYGFVRNYAKFIGLPEEEILALFKREYDEEKFHKVLPEGLIGEKDFSLRRIRFAQTFKVIILIFIVFLLYILFQYRYAIFNPPLDVDSPQDGDTITSQDVVVTGKTDSNATLFVNNEAVSLDKGGNFRKKINVFSGKSKITIKSINKFGRTTVVERNIEVKSPSE